jgi:HEAT repeat protein
VRRAFALVLLVLLAGAGLRARAEAVDAAKDLKSKDVAKRLAAVEALRKQGGAQAQALLLNALGDDDFEVLERAATALGERGGPESLKGLGKLAVEGPVRRVRHAAARSLAKLDPELAAKDLGKDLRGEFGARAAEALAILVQAVEGRTGEQLVKAADAATKSKEAGIRAAAAGALAALPTKDREERWQKLLEDEDLRVQAAALAEAARAADPERIALLVAKLQEPRLTDVIERRVAAAVVATFAKRTDAERKTAVATGVGARFAQEKNASVAARYGRLLGLLAARNSPPPPEPPAPSADGKPPAPPPAPAPAADAAPPPEPALAPAVALKAMEYGLQRSEDEAQAAGIAALGRIGTPEALDLIVTRLGGAPSSRAHVIGLRALVEGRGLDEPTRAIVEAGLAVPDVAVREEAARLLGRSGPDGAAFTAPVPALVKALADENWGVAAIAAVSLGKTRSVEAVEPLRKLLDAKAVKDWRRRGAAVVGLGQIPRREAVPALISALGDKEPYVRLTAFEYLRRLTKLTIKPLVPNWTEWWEQVGPKFEFEDRSKLAREMKKGGYAQTPEEVYAKVGTAEQVVVVLESRGDHIEKLLGDLGIVHEMTRQASLDSANLHPFAVFVSNCTGEVHEEDVKRLQWFVRVGGYLFGSCWALQHTIELVYPGLVRKLPTKAQVVQNVVAERCPGDNPYIEGVFPSFTQPTYVLSGAHLIEVLQPERVEVMADSPECAQTWGEGNLACWFQAGHGVILDSTNHFDLQGFESVVGLKSARDRMAYAMDHMGIDYDEMRKLTDAKVWDSQSEAVKTVKDKSSFRLISNFVRFKRRVDP